MQQATSINVNRMDMNLNRTIALERSVKPLGQSKPKFMCLHCLVGQNVGLNGQGHMTKMATTTI